MIEGNGDFNDFERAVHSKTLPECITKPSQTAIRVTHIWGHGEWHHPHDCMDLQGWVDTLNAKYGVGTHWIETQKAPTD